MQLGRLLGRPCLINQQISRIIHKASMGTSSIQYAVPVTYKPEGETAVYRHPHYANGLLVKPSEPISTIKEMLIHSYISYAYTSSLGAIVTKEGSKSVQYLSYKETIEKAERIGSSMITEALYSQHPSEKIRFVGIFSKNRVEWALTDIACALYRITSVPILEVSSEGILTFILRQTALLTIFVDGSTLATIMGTGDLGSLKTVVCYDPLIPEEIEFMANRGINLIHFDRLVSIGGSRLVCYNSEQFNTIPSDILTFSYTSGTTGIPKAVMISHGNMIGFLASAQSNAGCIYNKDDILLSYLPLPHILERQSLYTTLFIGAKVVFYSGNIRKLKDDLDLVRPTVFVSVPFFYSQIKNKILNEACNHSKLTCTAFQLALGSKIRSAERSGKVKHSLYDHIFFNKTKMALGGSVRVMLSGGAPLLPEVHSFLKVCIESPLAEAYGQSESTGAMFITDANDPLTGHVGGPSAAIEFKLVDVPEMNYFSVDRNQTNQLAPRGEIWVRGAPVFSGYYHEDDKTAEALTVDGWLKTGDIGMLLPKSNALKIIDRKKNIFKLQQGNYVAPEKVENIYVKSGKIADIFIYGDATQSFVVGIIVPLSSYLSEMAAKLELEGSHANLCKMDSIKMSLFRELIDLGKSEGLPSFEQIGNLYLTSERFSLKGFLTNTMKIQRHLARTTYKDEIAAMYKEGKLEQFSS